MTIPSSEYSDSPTESTETLQNVLADLLNQKYAIDQHAILSKTNVAGIITYVNSRFCEISGYSKEELLGKTHRIINSGYHTKEFFTEMYSTLKQEKVWKGEIRNRAKNGSFYWVDSTIVPFKNGDGNVDEYYAIRTVLTERKQVEEELRIHQIELEMQNEELRQKQAELALTKTKYFDLYNLTPVGYCTVSDKGLILEANLTIATLLGVKRNTLVNQALSKFILKEDHSIYYSRRKELFTTHQPQSFDLRMQSEHTEFWVQVDVTFNQDTNENSELKLTLTDITARKIMEDALIKNEKRYSELLMNLEAAVVVHAPDTSIMMHNSKASELLGLNTDQMKGKQAIDPTWKFLFENNTPLPLDEYPVNQILKTKKPIKNQVIGINRPITNDIIWVTVNGFPVFKNNGEIAEIVISFIDITGIKKAEKMIADSNEFNKKLIDFMYDGFSIVDAKGVYINANKAFTAMTGFSNEELIGSSPPFPYWPPEDYQSINSAFQTALQSKSGSFELTFMRKNGQRFPVIVSPTAIMDREGTIICYAATVKDISERKETELLLKKYTEELEHLNQTKDKFFGIIAHDLRNPFVGIKGISEMLENAIVEKNIENSSELLRYTRLIQSSSKAAFALLENLMQWARAQTGDIDMHLKNISMEFIFATVIPLIEGSAFKKNITIEKPVANNDLVYADETMLNTILRNLLTNAIKFTRPNGKIILSTKNIGRLLEISVTDTGVGINPVNLEKLFKIDSKFSKIGTDNEKGSGLGLILCKDFVEKQGGTVAVISEVGIGSTFTFTLPRGR